MKYRITTRRGFTGPRRLRAGIAVSRGQTIEADLDAEQVKAIQADPELVLEAVRTPRPASTAAAAQQRSAAAKKAAATKKAKEAAKKAESTGQPSTAAAAADQAERQMVENQAERTA